MRRDTEMGRTEDFIVANGMSQLYTGAQDVSPYSAFDDVLSNDANDIEFSEFNVSSGAMRRSRRKFKRGGNDGGGISSRNKERLNKAGNYYPPVAVARAVKRGRARRASGEKGRAGQFIERAGENIKKNRSRKAEENKINAQQQQQIIEQVSKNAPTVEQLNALMGTAPTANVNATPTKEPMSKTMKVVLIVGGIALAGIVAYVVYKKMKNKAK